MKLAEKKNDKDFVNLHSTDRKRKFRDLQNTTISFGVKSGENTPLNQTGNLNENSKNCLLNSNSETRRKILSIKSDKPKTIQNNINTLLSDQELDKLIDDVSVLTSRDQIKLYLRQKISHMISKNFLIQTFLF
jgi:hypothetical protein